MLTKFIEKFNEAGEIYLRVKARPGASASEVRGIMESTDGETLKIDVAAPPENGKANAKLIEYLSDWFSADKNKIKIISGASDKIKLIKIIK